MIKLYFPGINGYNFPDPHSLAMDYRSVGFRECASEVARYLVAVEGLDLQDPLRLRLLGHLQCFSAQREAAAVAKASFQNSSWNAVPSHPSINSQYTGSGMSSMGSMITSQNNQSELPMSTHSTHQSLSSVSFSESRIGQGDISSSSLHSNMRLPTNVPSHSQMPSMNSSNQPISPSLISTIPQLHSQFPVSLNMNSMPGMMSQNSYNSSSPSLNQHNVKPYRPWGSELAY